MIKVSLGSYILEEKVKNKIFRFDFEIEISFSDLCL